MFDIKGVTMDGGLDLLLDLLITCTHESELRAITAPSIISTIHKSPQHPLSLFQPSVSSSAIPWQRLLTVEILQLQALKSSLHRLPYRTDQALTLHLAYNISTRTTQQTQLFYFCVHVCCCGNLFAEPLPFWTQRKRTFQKVEMVS
jgi:hypothetical protein